MRRALIPLFLATGWLAGCSQAGSPPTTTADANDEWTYTTNPITHAQSKLPTMKIFLGSASLDAELALTPRQEQVGMMYRTNIQETDAMLFDLYVPQQASFWMKNCPESISCAYITPDGVIQEIHHLEKNDTDAVMSARSDIQFVLETQDGWFQRHNIGAGTVITSEKGPLAEALRRQ